MTSTRASVAPAFVAPPSPAVSTSTITATTETTSSSGLVYAGKIQSALATVNTRLKTIGYVAHSSSSPQPISTEWMQSRDAESMKKVTTILLDFHADVCRHTEAFGNNR